MTDYYLDASALVKRYADEAGSDWVRWITEPEAGNTILLAEVTLVEVAAALAAKQRASGGIALEERDRALSRFLQDCDEGFLILPVDRLVIDRAVELTQSHRLRGYDAIQLASALVAADLVASQNLSLPRFVASDGDLLSAAAVEHLPSENPLDH
ncbi:MAG: type II toxin-antitoxin system VapC family toxin [Anaerolineae bacterium]|nr:type II toxin-antitoxin system VapC family toxin [Anaerolineae bacterium]